MSNKRPNIILILLDDLGWRDLTCTGSDFYETPNIDRLSRNGMSFNSAYASCPVCSPSRASIMTGKYPVNVGITDWIDYGSYMHPLKGRLIDAPYIKDLPHSETSLATALREGGYHTWHVGKWHLGGEGFYPQDHGFDVNIGGSEAGAPSYEYGYFSPWNLPNLPEQPDGKYLTDHLGDEAVRLIEQNDDAPFFMHLSHYAVHHPLQAPADLVAKYEKKAIALGLDKMKVLEQGEPFHTEDKRGMHILRRLIQSHPIYAAMIESVDNSVGRVVEALERTGQLENTLIVFTSDNGGVATSEGSPTTNLPLIEGKGWMYEGGTRVAFLAHWPDVIAEGSLCDVPISSPDIYPTFLEAAGLPLRPEQHTDGASLMPAFRGNNEPAHDALFWHYPHYGNQGGTPGCSIRKGDYKLIHFFEGNRLELYHLKDDVGEQHNLAAELPEIAAELHLQLWNWIESVEAQIPQPNPDWKG